MSKKDKVKEEIEKITTPIFEKVLGEKIDNTRRGVSTVKFLWRPHNYRLRVPYFQDTRYKKNIKKKIRGTLPPKFTKNAFPVELLLKNYNSKAIAKVARRIKIIADKEKITAIYSTKDEKEKFWYLIKANRLEDIDERITEKVNDIEEQLIEGVKEFIELYGGRPYFKDKKWIRHEDDLKGEDFIDKIPQDLIITDTYFKKVYPTGVEFKKPAYLKNYISNRAVEELTPKIAEEINNLGSVIEKSLDKFSGSLSIYNKHILKHLAAIENIDKSSKENLKTQKFIQKLLSKLISTKKREPKVSQYQSKLNIWG